MDQHLVALFEFKRQSFLIGFIENPERFHPALAFAYYHRVAPIFHEQIAHERYNGDPFDEVYAVKRDFVLAVIKYVDERWLANDLEAIAFRTLEEKFGGYKVNRMELVYALEYARINRGFDENV